MVYELLVLQKILMGDFLAYISEDIMGGPP